jgi:lipoprotein NlpI
MHPSLARPRKHGALRVVSRSLLPLLAIALAAMGSALAADAPAPPTDAQRCATITAPAEREAACTALLKQSGLSPEETALAYYYRGFGRVDRYYDSAAELDFSVAIGFDPELWPARWARAELKSRHRNYADAAADWSEVIRHEPNIASLYAKRAVALNDLGRSEEAIVDETKAITLAGPKDPIARFYLYRADAADAAHQWPKARADYSEVIQRGGDLLQAYLGRARAELLSGDPTTALADAKKAAEIDATNGYPLLWLYIVERRSGSSGKDASTALRERSAKLNLQTWPGPIIQVLLGDRSAEQIPSPAQPAAWPEATRKAVGQCELSFFLGEARLASGERDRAMALFRAAVDTGMKEYVEYNAAAFELQRIGG